MQNNDMKYCSNTATQSVDWSAMTHYYYQMYRGDKNSYVQHLQNLQMQQNAKQ